MNNKQIQDLTLRLSHALDQNYDVVNFDAVLSVISALEGATITKEQLETTRLAKYINQLRRRTKSEQLARRAKSLLKKWREMVGIQQQTTESFSSMQEYQKHKTTSPITIICSEQGGNIFEKASTVSTFPAALSGSANIKKKSITGTTPSTVPIPPVPTTSSSQSSIQSNKSAISSQKQPTSFANLLTSISGGGQVSAGNFDDMLRSPSFRNSNKRKDRHDHGLSVGEKSKEYAVDQSYTVDLGQTVSSKNQMPIAIDAPIVIDIPDSNSSTGPTPTIAQNTTDGVCTLKSKNNKKDKKRKDRDSQPQSSSALCYISNVIEESFSSLRPPFDLESDKFNDKIQARYPISGISEILSLSNSSLTSMFPNNTVGNMATTGTSASNNQRPAEALGSSSNRTITKTLATSDLTFAGKFKQHTSKDSSDLFGLTAGSASTAAGVDSTSTLTKAQMAAHTFLPFGNGGNSNESTSTSRTSQFDVVDVVNQDNTQSKIIKELGQQNNQNIALTQTPAQNQDVNKKPVGSSFGVSQVLLPPTSGAHLRQLNSGSVVSSDSKGQKKRGRKKGSKGVDSIIAKETSLCSQMLMTTLGCKKVKTTKELYAEMQNRKLCMSSSTISSPTLCNWLSHHQVLQVSRPDSSCSEPSLHSPRTSDACSTNATISTVATRSTPDKATCNSHAHEEEVEETESETNTSDPSRDSATIQLNLKRISSTDSTSNSQLVSKVNVKTLINFLSVDSIVHEIKFLLTHFPPVPAIEKIEQECFEDVLPCTCKVTESLPTVFNSVQRQPKREDESISAPTNTNLRNNEADMQTLCSVDPQTALRNYKTLIEDVELVTTVPPPTQKVKKSIFDLDFDDEEDPLHQIRAEAVANPSQQVKSEIMGIETKFVQENSEENSKLDKKDMSELLSFENDKKTMETTNQVVVQDLQVVIFPTYTVEEDTHCVAKEYYEVKTQQITEFHITALHNYYIPNINGNWDNAEAFVVNSNKSSEVKTITKKLLDIAELSIGDLWSNVVPQYGSLITEYIPKDLCHFDLQSRFKHKGRKWTNDTVKNFLPFLGVAEKPLCLKDFARKGKAKGNCVRKSCSDLKTNNKRNTRRSNKKTTATSYIMREKSVQNTNAEAYSNNDHTYIKNDDYNKYSYIKESSKFKRTQMLKFVDSGNTSGSCCNDDELHSIYVASPTEGKRNAVFINVESNHNIDGTGGVYPRTLADNIENVNINTSSNSSRVESDLLTRNLFTVEFPERLCEHDKLPQQIVGGNQLIQSLSIQNISTDNATKTSTIDVASEPVEKELEKGETKKRRKRESLNKNKKKRKLNVEHLQISINGVVSTKELSRESTSSSDENCEDFGTESTGSSNVKFLQSDDEILGYNFGNEDCNDKDESNNEYNYKADHDYTSDCRQVVTQLSSVSNKVYDHIVLTIKKTPSNTNSSSSFISRTSSSVLRKKIPARNIFDSSNTNTEESISSKKLIEIDDKLIDDDNDNCYEKGISDVGAEDMLTGHSIDHSNDENDTSNVSKRMENIYSPSNHSEISTSPKNLSITKDKYKRRLKIIKKSAKYIPVSCKFRQKLHRKLFFSDELHTRTFGLKEKILNISSCSSSCDENSENEYSTTNDQFQRSHYKDTTLLKNTSTTNSTNNSQCSFYDYYSDCNTNSSYYSENNGSSTISINGENIVLQSPLATDEIKNDTTEKHRIDQGIKSKLEHDSKVYELNRDGLQFRDQNGELCLKNNGLLKSFNNIYLTADEMAHNQRIHSRKMNSSEVDLKCNISIDIENIKMVSHYYEEKEEQIPIKNCDVFSNYFNNDKNSKLDNSNNSLKESKESCSSNTDSNAENVATTVKNNNGSPTVDGTQRTGIRSLEEEQLVPHKEYRTGSRAVDEDVEDEEGNTCARIQQFKEWHQVLQLRSYNNELLTVLPYVVLE